MEPLIDALRKDKDRLVAERTKHVDILEEIRRESNTWKARAKEIESLYKGPDDMSDVHRREYARLKNQFQTAMELRAQVTSELADVDAQLARIPERAQTAWADVNDLWGVENPPPLASLAKRTHGELTSSPPRSADPKRGRSGQRTVGRESVPLFLGGSDSGSVAGETPRTRGPSHPPVVVRSSLGSGRILSPPSEVQAGTSRTAGRASGVDKGKGKASETGKGAGKSAEKAPETGKSAGKMPDAGRSAGTSGAARKVVTPCSTCIRNGLVCVPQPGAKPGKWLACDPCRKHKRGCAEKVLRESHPVHSCPGC